MLAITETWISAPQPADGARLNIFLSAETLEVSRDGLNQLASGIRELVQEARNHGVEVESYGNILRRVEHIIAFQSEYIERNDGLQDSVSIETLRIVKAGLLLLVLQKAAKLQSRSLPHAIEAGLNKELETVLERSETGVLEHLRPTDILFEIMTLKGLSFSSVQPEVSAVVDVPKGLLHDNVEKRYIMSLEVFISHSSKDSELAEAVIELIRSALSLPPERIRCSSVDGYRLPGGVTTDDQLKQEVRDAVSFVGLLTPNSLQSAYVFFELGARWGAQLPFVPLLAAGASSADLRPPLSGLNALQCDSASQMHQFIKEMGEGLHRPVNSAAVYDKHLQHLVALSKKKLSENGDPVQVELNVGGGNEETLTSGGIRELLDLIRAEPDPVKRGLVQIRKEIQPGIVHFFPKLQYAGKPLTMKTRHFRELVEQMVLKGFLHRPEENQSTNTRTYEYRGIG